MLLSSLNLCFLLAYSSDLVYLFHIDDEPFEEASTMPSTIPSNSKTASTPHEESKAISEMWKSIGDTVVGSEIEMDNERDIEMSGMDTASDEEDNDEDDEDEGEAASESSVDTPAKFRAPTILPRRQFVGACNVQTVKDGMHTFVIINNRRRSEWVPTSN